MAGRKPDGNERAGDAAEDRDDDEGPGWRHAASLRVKLHVRDATRRASRRRGPVRLGVRPRDMAVAAAPPRPTCAGAARGGSPAREVCTGVCTVCAHGPPNRTSFSLPCAYDRQGTLHQVVEEMTDEEAEATLRRIEITAAIRSYASSTRRPSMTSRSLRRGSSDRGGRGRPSPPASKRSRSTTSSASTRRRARRRPVGDQVRVACRARSGPARPTRSAAGPRSARQASRA